MFSHEKLKKTPAGAQSDSIVHLPGAGYLSKDLLCLGKWSSRAPRKKSQEVGHLSQGPRELLCG